MFASALSVFLWATAALAFVASVSEPSNPGGRSRCSTTISDEELIAAEKHFAANKASHSPTKRAIGDTEIQVFFHIISADDTPEGGNIPPDMLLAQINELRSNFAGTGLSFVTAGIDHTVNADWFNNAAPDSPQQTAMKAQLHQGGPATLNIYTVGFTSTDHLGYSTFPFNVEDQPVDDGVVILFSTVPGGATENFNLGRTLTHEVGHWVGLFHTFQGGCSGTGDLVFDTPAEASPASGCPTGRDTCPGGGADPIHNYMDFSDDSCMTQFTNGQILRLKQQLNTFRGINLFF